MTTPHFFIEEHQIINALFDEGLEILHFRKPNAEPVYSERLLSLINESYRKQIVVHDNFYLKQEYGLMGIHLSSRNPEPPKNYKGHISCSCHTAEEVKTYKKSCNYVLFSSVFTSNSSESDDDESSTNLQDLEQMSKQKIIDKKVMAFGGIELDKIRKVKDLGFGGVVVLGDIWNRFNIHSTQDFKELVNHFRQLRKLTD